MRQVLIVIWLSAFWPLSLWAQSKVEDVVVKVISLKKYEDGYLIKGIKATEDTLFIISYCDSTVIIGERERVEVNNTYRFKLDNFIKKGMPSGESLTILIGNKIIWKNGDSPNKIPFIARNTACGFIYKDYGEGTLSFSLKR